MHISALLVINYKAKYKFSSMTNYIMENVWRIPVYCILKYLKSKHQHSSRSKIANNYIPKIPEKYVLTFNINISLVLL